MRIRNCLFLQIVHFGLCELILDLVYLYYIYHHCCHSDKGMSHVTKSKDWIDLFDVVVCSAKKPFFYNDVNRYRQLHVHL